MKTFYFLLLFLAPLFSLGQVVVHDPALFEQGVIDLQRAQEALMRMDEQSQMSLFQAELLARRQMHLDSTDDARFDADKLAELQLAKQDSLYEHIRQINMPMEVYVDDESALLSELAPLLQGTKVQDMDALFRYFFPDTYRYDMDDFEKQTQTLEERRYLMRRLIKKQCFHLALVYFHLATQEAAKAEEFRLHLVTNDHLSMNEAERSLALLQVNRDLLAAVGMRRKALLMLQQALQPDPLEVQLQADEARRLRMERQIEQCKKIVPGYQNKE